MGTLLKDTLRCPLCQKTYSRREHLQRHLTLHGNGRPFICDRCQRCFTRRDVLKRHLTTCKADDGICLDTLAQADSSPRSTLCRACDRCQKHKRLCNFNQPCQSCLATNEACIYSWRSGASQNTLVRSNEISSGKLRDTNIPKPVFEQIHTTTVAHRSDRNPKITFDFLINFTTASGFASSFDNDLSFHRRQERHECSYSDAEASTVEYIGESYTPQVSLDFSQLDIYASESPQLCSTHIFGYPILVDGFEVRDTTTSWHIQPIEPTFTEHWLSSQQYYRPSTLRVDETKSTAHGMHWNSDPLTLKAIEIINRIKEATTLKPRNSTIPFKWSAILEETCLRFFCPFNLRKFIGLYWISWYPHWPVIHKPTFVASAAPCTLLAAMVLIGASYSPDIADRDNARIWFNAVEEMVFSDDYFCDDADMITASHIQQATIPRRQLQALQAAHAICLCQAYEGDNVSKRRARHHRINAVVALARSLGFAEGKHENLWNMMELGFSWQEFVVREEIIRTLIYVFVLDSGFVIFYNLPPRLVIQEARTSLVCPEACFQAPTASECLKHIKTWTSHKLYRPNLSLSSAVQILCRKDLSQYARDFFIEIGSVNLLIIAAVFNSMAFHFRPTLGQAAKLVPLQNAISHWGDIWSARPAAGKRSAFGTPSTEMVSFTKRNEMWKRLGFMKHAHEFWMLSRIIVDRIASSQGCLLDADNVSDPARGGENPNAYVLDQYDQTSMDQLRTTILAAADSQLLLRE